MIKTINIRDLIKYLVRLVTIIFVTVCSSRFFLNRNNGIRISFPSFDFEKILNANISIAKNSKTDTLNQKYASIGNLTKILEKEILYIDYETDDINYSVESNTTDTINQTENQTEERTVTEIKDVYTNTYKTVTVKNLTDIKLTEEILTPNYEISNKNTILIYHTHTCESYTPTSQNSYIASGNFRTIDMNYSVARVGKTLKDELKQYNISAIQDDTKHDYPAYTGSYTRSLETVKNMLKNNSTAEIIFDLHRDAVGDKSNYAPTVEINGEKVAQLMFVIGTNDGGGKHLNWKNNLKVAVMIQEKANEMYPGLFRSINLRTSVFNQNVSNASSIIEVGATGNTLEEANLSMKYLAEILNEVLNS